MALEHDVAELQAAAEAARSEADALRALNAVQAKELDMLRIEAVRLRGETLYEVRRSDAMYTILQQVSVGLIAGIARMNSLEGMEREARRKLQEDRLGVGGDDPPPVGSPGVDPTKLKTNPVITRADGSPKDRVTNRVGDRHLDTASGFWWEMEVSGWRSTGYRDPDYGPGIVRTDIVDSRLPTVEFGPDDAARALSAMNDGIAARQGAPS